MGIMAVLTVLTVQATAVWLALPLCKPEIIQIACQKTARQTGCALMTDSGQGTRHKRKKGGSLAASALLRLFTGTA